MGGLGSVIVRAPESLVVGQPPEPNHDPGMVCLGYACFCLTPELSAVFQCNERELCGAS